MPPQPVKTYSRIRITTYVVVLLFFLILGYAYFEGRGLTQGPEIILDLKEDVFTSEEELVSIAGRAERINELTVNGRPVLVTEDGTFYEEFLLSRGYNRVLLEAKDKAGRTTEKEVGIMYAPKNGSEN